MGSRKRKGKAYTPFVSKAAKIVSEKRQVIGFNVKAKGKTGKNSGNTRTWPAVRSRRYFLFRGACFRAMLIGSVINTWKSLVRQRFSVFSFLYVARFFQRGICRVNLFRNPATVKFFNCMWSARARSLQIGKLKRTRAGSVSVDKSEESLRRS